MKAKIIRLKDNKLSSSMAQECITQAKKFNIHVAEFDAINGMYVEDHLASLNMKPAKKLRPGVKGCILSHIYLWKNCVNDQQPYLILEHDGYFIEPLPENILDRFEDVLKLDNFNPYSKVYDKNIQRQKNKTLEIIDLEDQPKFYDNAGLYSRGSYAYIIKPKAAEKLLTWIHVNGFLPSDHQLGNDICHVKTVNKTIARLHPDYGNSAKALSLTNNLEALWDH